MPLSFDLPLEELRNYNGRNPRPADMDEYWNQALAELESIPPDLDCKPATQKPPIGGGPEGVFAEYNDLWFTSTGGARIYAKLVKPVGSAAKRRAGPDGRGPAVIYFHGYSVRSGDWESMLALAASGFTVAALDCRGQGGLSEDVGGVKGNTLQGHIVRGLTDALEGKPEKLLYRDQYLDTVRIARIVMGMENVDPARVGVSGWSQGGGLTLACAALEPRIARAAPVYPFLSDYKRVWEMDKAVDAYAELSLWFRRFDALHEQEDRVFNALGYIDIQHLASRIRADVLMATGLMDTVCPPSTQFAAYNKITSKKHHLIYPDFKHEDIPGLHDRILDFMLQL